MFFLKSFFLTDMIEFRDYFAFEYQSSNNCLLLNSAKNLSFELIEIG